MKEMLLIKDLKGWFWATFPNWQKSVSLDVEYMVNYFRQDGYSVEVTSYDTFDFQKDYSKYIVLYGSCEDYCGGSKQFIEDVIVHLWKQGAFLIPEFKYFRAHDNKVMMEILRTGFQNADLKSIHSKVWSSLEALKEDMPKNYPLVIKKATGAGSSGVFLAHNKKELLKYAEKISRMVDRKHFYYRKCANLIDIICGREPKKLHNSKFITQNFIPGLSGDYKVLVFGENYFVLHRLTDKNDFRASGSGKFTEDNPDEITAVLEFARLCTTEILSPWVSLDICFDHSQCHLIEFQCISFGFKAMSMSEAHYRKKGEDWVKITGKVNPEEEFCKSVLYFLNESEKLSEEL